MAFSNGFHSCQPVRTFRRVSTKEGYDRLRQGEASYASGPKRRRNPRKKRTYYWCEACDDVHVKTSCPVAASPKDCPELDHGIEMKLAGRFALRHVSPLGGSKAVQLAEQNGYLGPIRHWACGFCCQLFDAYASYTHHVHEHLKQQQRHPRPWKHSLVILGLLQQESVREAWRTIVDSVMLFRRFRWIKKSTGRAPHWMSAYDRSGQLQDYLERFAGTNKEAYQLAQLAFDLSCQATWLRERAPTVSSRTKVDGQATILLKYYRTKPLPIVPYLPRIYAKDLCVGNAGTAVNGPNFHGNRSVLRPFIFEPTRPPHHSLTAMTKRSSAQTATADDLPFSKTPHDSVTDTPDSSELSNESQTSDEETTGNEDVAMTSEELTKGALNTVMRDTVRFIMQDFYDRWSSSDWMHSQPVDGGTAHTGASAHDGSSTDASGEADPIIEQLRLGKQKRKRNSSGNSSDGDDNGGRRPRQSAQSSVPGLAAPAAQKLACPFRKHDPIKYSLDTHRVCAASGWSSIHRLKEHLNRCHRAIYCPRCKDTFKSKAARDAHINVPSADICNVQDGVTIEGITDEQECQLRSRKKTSRDQTDEDRWSNIYTLLFPLEPVPSPYFEPINDSVILSPTTNNFTDCEGYIRQQVPQLVRNHLINIARSDFAPVEQRLLGNLQHIIQDCIQTAFNQYREASQLQGEHTNNSSMPQFSCLLDEGARSLDPPLASSAAAGPTALDPSFDFLDSIYSMPPVLTDNTMHFSSAPLNLGSATEVPQTDSGYSSCQICSAESPETCSCYEGLLEDPFAGELDEMGKFSCEGPYH
ncbi:Resistance to glucose repression protein [Paramyrothecium foliicola]|nr:Resistance to glucose repression protein [Paramyrothecium foliicola]